MLIKSAEFVISAVRPQQYPAEELPEFAFAGRSNVGKSSLINTLVSRRKLVQTSSTPGKTRLINFFRVNDALMFVDLPGYGYARVSEEERRKWRPMIEQYLSRRENLKAVVLILDIRRTPNEEDAQLLNWLARREVAAVLVVTKADKLSKTSQLKQLKIIAGALETDPDELVLFSAKSRLGRDVLWRTLMNLATPAPEDERA
ncbi:MAG TPA: ribosome biogenesis GTP-binding protein YihA/YsxC [Desulfobacterales bacterium]|jgi:GTP-binding protein|nr:ribosome biogenesis GTP-binding protein YihA/YsxC [Desulfobacterales bacterium]HSM90957.1 ribosome biogenesis GTP-binding protein YihA/YsxC [Desulfobacterales bacterium]